MRNKVIKILGMTFYVVISLPLVLTLWKIRNDLNWVSGAIREIAGPLLIGLTSIYFLTLIILLIRKKINKNYGLTLLAIVTVIPTIGIPYYGSPMGRIRNKKELEGVKQKIDLMYVQWACYCPSWVEPENLEKASKEDRYSMHIDPTHDSLTIPLKYLVSGNIFTFTGQFYKYPQYGKDVEDGGLARTFRYTEYEKSDTVQTWSDKELKRNPP